MTHSATHGDQYMEMAIRTAAPPRLRLMLIERAIGLAEMLNQRWSDTADDGSGWDEQSLKLNDILTELLSGIRRDESELAKQVSDIYVFLIGLLHRAARHRRPESMADLRRVLESEAETWRQVCARAIGEETPPETPPEARPQAIAMPGPVAPAARQIASAGGYDGASVAGSLNLEG